MKFIYNDGGRQAAGYKGTTGDCCCRAIAIAAEMPYQEVYDLINKFGREERANRKNRKGNTHNGSRSDARTGVYKDTMRKIMDYLGWKWVPTMNVGSGCKVHLREEELPKGRLIVRVAKHFVAVIDGVLYDTWDSQQDGNRCVYGYWVAPPKMVPMPGIEKLSELKAEYPSKAEPPRKEETISLEFTKEELREILDSYKFEEIKDTYLKIFNAWLEM